MKRRTKAAILSGLLVTFTLILSGCSSNELKTQLIGKANEKTFKTGEHTISIPVQVESQEKIMQVEAHPGYDPISISVDYSNPMSIAFTNNEEVICTSFTIDEEGKYIYTDFGTPVSGKEYSSSRTKMKEFEVGQHLVLEPLKYDYRDKNMQYENHEGYKIIGINGCDYRGEFEYGFILYENTVRVKCPLSQDGYTTFGMPIENEMALQLD